MSGINVDAIERLANKVLAGEVVFFVGAGFSVDSEKNTAQRLIARLLVRFEAITRFLLARNAETKRTESTRRLRNALGKTFRIRQDRHSYCTATNIDKLASDYYLINDWMCSAFTKLLEGLDSLAEKKAAAHINRIENRLLAGLKTETVELEAMESFLLSPGIRDRGKALFLETMGFANPEIMGGTLDAQDTDTLHQSFNGRLLPRHHILARLAREGLCPLLVTTNYDLLLEGAYLHSGFHHRAQPPTSLPPPQTEHLPYTAFTKVACAEDFFRFGSGHRTALIMKMHGCVESYRQARTNTTELQRCLPSMVFTFREIQHWRHDAWSRDYLRTLLRTRTIAFCGYSGADAVVHDTFRSVSEEMACYRHGHALQEAQKNTVYQCVVDSPTFYFGGMDEIGFHGLEMLRASTRAIGIEDPDLADHPNYLRFHFPTADDSQKFPSLDDLMLWLFHRTYRKRQRQILHSNLASMVSMLLGHPCPPYEFERLNTHFDALCREEIETVKKSQGSHNEQRHRFSRLTAWTVHFQAGLLREMVEAERMAGQNGPFHAYWQNRQFPDLYHAAGNHPGPAAWAIVVEVAVRRMIACWRSKGTDWIKDDVWVSPGQSGYPAIHFAKGADRPSPTCLCLGMIWPEGQAIKQQHQGAFRRLINWGLFPHQGIHSRQNGKQRTGQMAATPSANLLWKMATCAEIAPYQTEIKHYFEAQDA